MADEIRDAFNAVYADGPVGNASEPQKSEIRSRVGGAIQTAVDGLDARVSVVEGTVGGLPGEVDALGERVDDVEAALIAGIKPAKQSVRLLMTTNVDITTAMENGDTLDALVLATGNRVALTGQTAPAQNGVYVVQATGAAIRSTDMDTEAELVAARFDVDAGTHASETWGVETPAPIVVGTTALSIIKTTSANLTTAEVQAARAGTTATYPTLGDHIIAIEASSAQPVTGGLTDPTVDAADNLILHTTRKEIYHPHMITVDARSKSAEARSRALYSLTARNDVVNLLAQVCGIPLLGQSLSIGFGGSTSSDRRAWLTNVYMPSPGGPDWYSNNSNPAVSFAALQPLWRSGASAAFKMLRQLLWDEDGIDIGAMGQDFLVPCAGVGGQTLASLAGGTYYPRFVTTIQTGKTRANALSKNFAASLAFMIHGETDATNNNANYGTELAAYQVQTENTVKTETGTTASFPFLINQICSHIGAGSTTGALIPYLQLAATANAKIGFVCPTYMFTYVDNLHMSTLVKTGYEWMGAYYGLALKRWAWDGVKPTALQPVRSRKLGSSIILEYDLAYGRKLAFDTTLVAAQAANGFNVYTSGGSPLTIDSTVIFGGNKVALNMAVAPTIGDEWRYGEKNVDAWAGGTTEPGSKGKGNLRNDDPMIFDPRLSNLTMYRWAAIAKGAVA